MFAASRKRRTGGPREASFSLFESARCRSLAASSAPRWAKGAIEIFRRALFHDRFGACGRCGGSASVRLGRFGGRSHREFLAGSSACSFMHLVDSAKGAELSAFFCGPFLGRKDSLKNLDFGKRPFPACRWSFGCLCWSSLCAWLAFRCCSKFLWSLDSSVLVVRSSKSLEFELGAT